MRCPGLPVAQMGCTESQGFARQQGQLHPAVAPQSKGYQEEWQAHCPPELWGSQLVIPRMAGLTDLLLIGYCKARSWCDLTFQHSPFTSKGLLWRIFTWLYLKGSLLELGMATAEKTGRCKPGEKSVGEIILAIFCLSPTRMRAASLGCRQVGKRRAMPWLLMQVFILLSF